jgi:hypothetical protein
VAAVVTGIYSTLWLAGTLEGIVSNRELLGSIFFFSFILLVAVIVATGLTKRPTLRDIWLTIGVTAAYGMIAFRLGGSAAERTHLFEYGLVAVLMFQALTERRQNGRRVPVPAVLAWGATSLIGCLDEGIQALLPSRVFDPIDIGVNTLAALMAIVASVVIIRVRTWSSRERE